MIFKLFPKSSNEFFILLSLLSPAQETLKSKEVQIRIFMDNVIFLKVS